MVTKIHPTFDNNPKSFLGKTISQYILDFKNDVIGIADITGITLTDGETIKIGVASTDIDKFSPGSVIRINGVVGTTSLNGNTYVVGAVNSTANTFELVGTLSNGHTAYTSGGKIENIGPNSTIQQVIRAISERATIVMTEDIARSGNNAHDFIFYLEGEFPTDTYDGENSETFAAYMLSVINALGTVDGFDLSNASIELNPGKVFSTE